MTKNRQDFLSQFQQAISEAAKGQDGSATPSESTPSNSGSESNTIPSPSPDNPNLLSIPEDGLELELTQSGEEWSFTARRSTDQELIGVGHYTLIKGNNLVFKTCEFFHEYDGKGGSRLGSRSL